MKYYTNSEPEIWKWDGCAWYVWVDEDDDYPSEVPYWFCVDYGENILGDIKKYGIRNNNLKEITKEEAFLEMI